MGSTVDRPNVSSAFCRAATPILRSRTPRVLAPTGMEARRDGLTDFALAIFVAYSDDITDVDEPAVAAAKIAADNVRTAALGTPSHLISETQIKLSVVLGRKVWPRISYDIRHTHRNKASHQTCRDAADISWDLVTDLIR